MEINISNHEKVSLSRVGNEYVAMLELPNGNPAVTKPTDVPVFLLGRNRRITFVLENMN